jgi:hypothetical protein
MPFVVVDDYRPGLRAMDSFELADKHQRPSQLDLFGAAVSARTGEL